MGCLRLVWAFIASLLATAVLTIVGGVFGGIISSLVVSHGAIALNPSSPGVYIGGGVGLLLGLLVMRASMKGAAKVNWLKSHGTRITATVADIKKEWVYTQVPDGSGGNRTQPVPIDVIVAQWIDPRTQQPYTFRSNKPINPRRFSKGDSISVLIDPNNPGSRYQVEV